MFEKFFFKKSFNGVQLRAEVCPKEKLLLITNDILNAETV